MSVSLQTFFVRRFCIPVAKRMKGQLTPIAIQSNYPMAGRIRDILPIGGTAVQTLAHATVNLQIL